MPRTSRHGIELSAAERVELERRPSTVTLAFRVVQHARMMLYAAEDSTTSISLRGWTALRIASRGDDHGPALLDRYARTFESKRLRPNEYVISADEKTQLQALGRHHQTVAPGPGRPGLVEFD